jgi:3-hydroxyacyl-CoA dehydrogenase
MGGGIAQVAAQTGFRVILGDLKEEYAKVGFEKIKERLEKRVSEGMLESIDIDRILSNVKMYAFHEPGLYNETCRGGLGYPHIGRNS